LEPIDEPPDDSISSEAAPSHQVSFPFALRLGFRMIGGLSQALMERVVATRVQGGQFLSWDDLIDRTWLSRAMLSRLSRADVFRSLSAHRRDSLWRSLPAPVKEPLLSSEKNDEAPATLPSMPPVEEVFADYRTMGLSLRAHPVSFLRQEFDQRRITPAKQLARLEDGRSITVAGIVLMRQRPSTASGVTFVTLEDETGLANLIIHARVWERHYLIARKATLLEAHGKLQRHEEVVHIVVSRLKDLSHHLHDLPLASRDFR
jgi:error-prone DNA polymerase